MFTIDVSVPIEISICQYNDLLTMLTLDLFNDFTDSFQIRRMNE